MSSKSKQKPTRQVTLNKAVGHALVIFLWAFAESMHPTQEQLDIVSHEVKSVRDSVMKGSLTIPQIRKALKDNYGLEA